MVLNRTGSIWNRENRNSINENWDVLDKVLRNLNDLVIKGQLTPTQFAELTKELNGLISRGQVSVHDIDKNKGLFDQSFLSPELLEQIAGTAPILSTLADGVVTTSKLADRVVSPNKTTFFDMNTQIWDGTYIDGMLTVVGGRLEARLNYGGWTGKVAEIQVEPNSTISINVDPVESNILRIGAHNEKMTFVDSAQYNYLNRTIYSGSAGESETSYTFTTTNNERYIYIYVSNEGKSPWLEISTNAKLKSEFIPEKIVSPENTTFFKRAEENIFDGIYDAGMLIAQTNHTLLMPRANYAPYEGKTAIIEIKPNTEYTVNVVNKDNNIFRVGADFELKTFPEGTSGIMLNRTIFSNSAGDNDHTVTFTSNVDDYYLYVYVSNDGSEPALVVSEGNQSTAEYIIPKEFLELPGNINYELDKDSKFNFTGDFSKLYELSQIKNYSTPEDAQVMNDKFIALVNAHNDIASYKRIGSDSLGNNIYSFESKPLDYKYTTETGSPVGDVGANLEKPKIVITGTVHGSERGVSYFLYEFLKELLENPKNDATIDSFLQNVHLIVIPIVNPSGFNALTYNNHNNININRNFPSHGSLSQVETQIVKEILDANSDMDFFFDAHNMFARDGLIGYSRTDDELFKSASVNVYKNMGNALQRKFSYFPQERNHRWAFSGIANIGTVGKYVEDYLNVPSVLYEVPRMFDFGTHTNFDEDITKFGAEVTMNLIFSAIRSKQ